MECANKKEMINFKIYCILANWRIFISYYFKNEQLLIPKDNQFQQAAKPKVRQRR